MRERLGEIAKMLSCDAELLRKQADMIGIAQQFLEQQVRLLHFMGSGKCFNEPKRACREAAFNTFQSIYITFRTLSSYQRIDSEIAFDSGKCRQPARIRTTDETNQRHQERGSIHLLRTLKLNERTLLLVPEILVNIADDGVAAVLHPAIRPCQ
jgi:hypothetical protein